jgi:hypothetical protein
VRRVYTALTFLLLLAVLVQFYFAAVGAFTKPQKDNSFVLHSVTGTLVIPLLSLLATIVAALARAPGRLIGLSILPLGLVVVQVLIIVLGDAVSGSADNTTPAGVAILGLHAINGLAILGVSGLLFRRARMLAGAPRDATVTSAPAAAATQPTAPAP